ncbi:MAG: hypothetical protein GF332_01300 [Candidatus Moranbacteria bacterium]|nr:hypothetical protein [Candidatus Moranbacteria bacterium]
MQEDRSATGTLAFLILVVNVGIFIILILQLNSQKKLQTVLEEFTENNQQQKTQEITSKKTTSSSSQTGQTQSSDQSTNQDSEQDQSDDDESDQDSDQDPPRADHQAKKIFAEFADNQEQADLEYQNKTISIQGQLDEITETDSDKVKITLEAGDDQYIACLSKISQSNTQTIVEDQVNDQDEIVVKGIVDGLYEDELELENCQLVQD